jgi:hypothetical protein
MVFPKVGCFGKVTDDGELALVGDLGFNAPFKSSNSSNVLVILVATAQPCKLQRTLTVQVKDDAFESIQRLIYRAIWSFDLHSTGGER